MRRTKRIERGKKKGEKKKGGTCLVVNAPGPHQKRKDDGNHNGDLSRPRAIRISRLRWGKGGGEGKGEKE